MKLLDLTLESVAANLALDEALIEDAEAGRLQEDVLRLWEAARPAVIVGRSSRVRQEVNLEYCRANDIPVLRRCSGGAAVVIGPGCLMYGVVLSYDRFPALRMVNAAHEFVLENLAKALQASHPQVHFLGISDLTVSGRKVSGNSLRCKRDHLLYHGTLLCRFPLELISKCLGIPPRQPEYRAGRPHHEFVTNLECSPEAVRRALVSHWDLTGPLEVWPQALTQQLIEERYAQSTWNDRY